MPKIRIERNTGWIGQLRRIEIFIDGEKMGTVNDGETKDYEIEKGKHEVYAKLGWERSQKIELNIVESEITVLKLTLYKYGTLILLINIALLALSIVGKDTLNFEFKHYIILSAILILHPIYYMIKNKTVILTKINKKNVLQHGV